MRANRAEIAPRLRRSARGLRSAARKSRGAFGPRRGGDGTRVFSFVPTEYRGLAELGQIAGCGMIIAFLTSITLLPAL